MSMDREQFEDLMLSDQKTFASYARLFMYLNGTQPQGFLNWCWEKYLTEARPTPHSSGFGVYLPSDSADTICFGNQSEPHTRGYKNE